MFSGNCRLCLISHSGDQRHSLHYLDGLIRQPVDLQLIERVKSTSA